MSNNFSKIIREVQVAGSRSARIEWRVDPKEDYYCASWECRLIVNGFIVIEVTYDFGVEYGGVSGSPHNQSEIAAQVERDVIGKWDALSSDEQSAKLRVNTREELNEMFPGLDHSGVSDAELLKISGFVGK